MDEQPKYLMRFVGFKEDGSGELKRGTPGGFKQHELRELPFDYSLEPYWEIVDDIPDLVLPEEEPEDSVYVEEVSVPTEKPGEILVPVDAVDIAPPPDDEEKALFLEPGEEITSISGQGHMMTVKLDPDEAAEDESLYVDDKATSTRRDKFVLPIDVDMDKVTEIDYESMNVPSLKLFIEQRGGKVESKWLKPDLVRVARELEEALRAA